MGFSFKQSWSTFSTRNSTIQKLSYAAAARTAAEAEEEEEEEDEGEAEQDSDDDEEEEYDEGDVTNLDSHVGALATRVDDSSASSGNGNLPKKASSLSVRIAPGHYFIHKKV